MSQTYDECAIEPQARELGFISTFSKGFISIFFLVNVHLFDYSLSSFEVLFYSGNNINFMHTLLFTLLDFYARSLYEYQNTLQEAVILSVT